MSTAGTKQPGFSATDLPTPEQIKKASSLAVFDQKNRNVSYLPGPNLVLTDCGLCQEYVKHVNEVITPEAAEKDKIRLFFVGCGDASLIKGYGEVVGNKFPMYSQPNKDIYVALGMTLRTLERAGDNFKRPSHRKKGTGGSIFSGMMGAFKMGNLFARFGDIKQMGGEFVFEGPGPKAIYAHRMSHAQDHAEINDVLAAAKKDKTGGAAGDTSNGPVAATSAADKPAPTETSTAAKPEPVRRETAAGAVSGAAVTGGPLAASGVHGAGGSSVPPPNAATASVPSDQPAPSPAPAHSEPVNDAATSAGSVGTAAVAGGPLNASATHGGGESTVSPPNASSAADASSAPAESSNSASNLPPPIAGSPFKTTPTASSSAAAPSTSEAEPATTST